MSKLEPGCKAIIIKGRCIENIGKIVTVGNFIGDNPDEPWSSVSDYWETDKLIFLARRDMSEKITRRYCSGETMQRIDDHKTKIFKSIKEPVLI